jgi:hypothetical protein
LVAHTSPRETVLQLLGERGLLQVLVDQKP